MVKTNGEIINGFVVPADPQDEYALYANEQCVNTLFMEEITTGKNFQLSEKVNFYYKIENGKMFLTKETLQGFDNQIEGTVVSFTTTEDYYGQIEEIEEEVIIVEYQGNLYAKLDNCIDLTSSSEDKLDYWGPITITNEEYMVQNKNDNGTFDDTGYNFCGTVTVNNILYYILDETGE